MTATNQTDSRSPSRRTLLAGAIGGLGALAASALGRPAVMHAADGGNAILGQVNTSTTETSFESTNAGAVSLKGSHGAAGTGVSGASVSGIGVHGFTTNSASNGVVGESVSGTGVYGVSSNGMGVEGYSLAVNGPGIRGWSGSDSTGLQGHSGAGAPLAPKTKTGVYGYAAQDSNARGLWGETTSGRAVQGTATTGFAGYFAGKVYVSKFQEMPEVSTPPAPGANKARLFVRASGSGKTQLCVRFNTGGVLVIKTQP